MPKYQLATTKTFDREYKKMLKRGYNTKLLEEIVEMLLNDEILPIKNKDHALTGNWKGYRECHIQPDWLLVYRKSEDRLILSLSRTGTHSDLRF